MTAAAYPNDHDQQQAGRATTGTTAVPTEPIATQQARVHPRILHSQRQTCTACLAPLPQVHAAFRSPYASPDLPSACTHALQWQLLRLYPAVLMHCTQRLLAGSDQVFGSRATGSSWTRRECRTTRASCSATSLAGVALFATRILLGGPLLLIVIIVCGQPASSSLGGHQPGVGHEQVNRHDNTELVPIVRT
jgi:hypothetical protein